MKRIVLLVSFVVALALCAGAQQITVDFHDMNLVKAPMPMPSAYPPGAHLNWENFYYVTPSLWPKAGPGFRNIDSTSVNTVAFTGGSALCPTAATCAAKIKLVPGMIPVAQTFTPQRFILSAGWANNIVTIVGYNGGKFVGSKIVKLTTTPLAYTFDTPWKVTELVFIPGIVPGPSITPQAGSMVIYEFKFFKQ